jgi:aminopeptidase N
MRTIGRLGVVVLLVATGAAAPTADTTAQAGLRHPTRFTPGSGGVGDPYLNEGFATFSQWLWAEHTGGPSTYSQARSYFRGIPASNRFCHQSVAAPGRNTMFSSAVYALDGMTLAALRHKIGDEVFLRNLCAWVREHEHGSVTTGQFTSLAARVSGRSLDHFLQVWLYRKPKPGQL